MIRILFHDDWEINGDGTGDPESLMFEPAKKLLAICDRFGARYTFFAEVMQQLAMLESSEKKHRIWAVQWEEILKSSIERGHDVQLHLHPQWLGAAFRNGVWNLDYSKWSIAALDEDEIYSLLVRGKEYLEGLLRPIHENYRTVAFRAGGWMAQPSGPLIRAMKRAGIRVDCSVVPGRTAWYHEHPSIDYRNAPSGVNAWETSAENLIREGESGEGIIELPTYSEKYHLPLPVHLLLQRPMAICYYAKIFPHWKKTNAVREFSPRDRLKEANMVCHQARLGKVFQSRTTYASFGYMHYKTLSGMVRNAIRIARSENAVCPSMVMLTHSKSFFSYSNFERLLKEVSSNRSVRFMTTQDWLDEF